MLTFEAPMVRIRMGKRIGFAEQAPGPPLQKISPLASTLALGHRIVRAVESGEMRDFTEVARRMGVSQARVSMLVALTFLSPKIQEAILLGERGRIRYHRLVALARMEGWEEQMAAAEGGKGSENDPGRKSPIRNLEAEPRPNSRPKASRVGRKATTGRSFAAADQAREARRELTRTASRPTGPRG